MIPINTNAFADTKRSRATPESIYVITTLRGARRTLLTGILTHGPIMIEVHVGSRKTATPESACSTDLMPSEGSRRAVMSGIGYLASSGLIIPGAHTDKVQIRQRVGQATAMKWLAANPELPASFQIHTEKGN